MKGNLIQGTTRGRLGNVVSKVVHGEQLYAKYQPVVFNPRSPKQRTQRDFFTRASIFAKGVVGNSKVNNVYAVQRGAAKSLFINIQRLIVLSQRVKHDATGIISKLSEPLMVSSINGNSFNEDWAIIANEGMTPIVGNPVLGGSLHFGSISKLSSENLLITNISTNAISDLGMHADTDLVGIYLYTDSKSSASPVPGFHTDPLNCGNWPFIYTIILPDGKPLLSRVPDSIGSGNEAKIISHFMYATDKGEVVGYQVTSPELPIVP